MCKSDEVMARLEDQISWYDRRAVNAQRWFKGLKLVGIVAAAFVPFAAGLGTSSFLTGGLGVLVVIVEGMQQLNQYHCNWISYRGTCEALKHERALYLAKACSYSDIRDTRKLLAVRTEALISREHAAWALQQREQESEAAASAQNGKVQDSA